MFFKKGALKYLAKLAGKHVYRNLFQKKFQTVGLQLFLKRDIFNSSEQFFYSTHVNPDLIEYLETLTIDEDLRKCLKILTPS